MDIRLLVFLNVGIKKHANLNYSKNINKQKKQFTILKVILEFFRIPPFLYGHKGPHEKFQILILIIEAVIKLIHTECLTKRSLVSN